MATVGNLSAYLSADTADLENGLRRARSTLNSTQAGMNRSLAAVEKSFQSLGEAINRSTGNIFSLKGAIGALAGVAGVGSFGYMMKSALDSADALAKAADRSGLAVEAFQELRYAAGLSGVSVEQMEAAFRKLNIAIGQAEKGNAAAAERFRSIGVALRDARGNMISTDKVLESIADRIAAAGTAAEKARIANAAFGEEGAKLMPLLKGGGEGLREMRDEAQRLGLVLTEDMARGAEAANDAMDRMKQMVGVNLQKMLLALAPTIVRLGAAAANAAPKIVELAESFLPLGMVGTQEIGRRIKALEDEFEGLMGVGFRRVLDDMGQGRIDPDQFWAWVGPEKEGQVRQIIGSLRELDDAYKAATTQETLFSLPGEPEAEGVTKAKDAIGEYISSLREAVELLEVEADQREVTQALLRAEALARQQGVELTDQQRAAIESYVAANQQLVAQERQRLADQQRAAQITESVRTETEKYRDAVDELNSLWERGLISGETYGRRLKELQDDLAKVNETTQEASKFGADLGMSFSSAFEDAILRGQKFSDVLKGLAEDVARLLLRQTVTAPLASAIGSINFGGFFADGGRPPLGRISVVGERGPELFVPDTAGTIIPNQALGGGAPVTVQNTYNFTSGVQRNELIPILEANRAQTIAEIRRLQNKRGNARL